MKTTWIFKIFILSSLLIMTAFSSSGQPETADIVKITREIEVGVDTFPVADHGKGPVVLLLHGFPDSRYLWRYQIPALADAGFRVVAPDLQGFGDAPKPEEIEKYKISVIMNQVLAMMDTLGVEEFYLVGHDWGAFVAWLIAAIHPERVQRLVALSVGCPGTSGGTTFEQLQRSWYAMLFRYSKDPENWIKANDWEFFHKLTDGDGDQERYKKDLSRPGALTAALNWYRANYHLNYKDIQNVAIPTIRCPVLGIWSDGDRYLTENHMLSSPENIDGPWKYEKIKDASHWMMLDKPEELNRLLIEFFE